MKGIFLHSVEARHDNLNGKNNSFNMNLWKITVKYNKSFIVAIHTADFAHTT